MVIAHTAGAVLLVCLVVLAGACSPTKPPPVQDDASGAPTASSSQEDHPRVRFLIGLGDTGGPKRDLPISMKNEDGSVRSFAFDQEKADARRAKAIEGEYRNGTSYQLNDDGGRPLPVFWKPWAPRVAARELEVPAKDTIAALAAARAGQPYDATLVTGGWLYAPQEWYGADLPGFTEETIETVEAGKDRLGQRAVNYTVKPSRQGDFATFTEQFIDHTHCLVVDDEILSNPVIRGALSDRVQITGGGTGFTAEEQAELIRALGGK